MNKINRTLYFVKRFLRYFLFGVVASTVPFLFFGMLLGLPAVFFGSNGLASYDVLALREESQVHKTLTRLLWKVWVLSLLVAVSISVLYLYVWR